MQFTGKLKEYWQEVLGEREGIIQEACFVADQLVINYLTHGCSALGILGGDGILRRVALPGLERHRFLKPL